MRPGRAGGLGPRGFATSPGRARRARPVPSRCWSRFAPAPPLEESRRRTRLGLERFHAGIERFVYPHRCPAGLEASLYRRRTDLVLALRDGAGRAGASA